MNIGTRLTSPEGRQFKVHVDSGGQNQRGQALLVLERLDRQPREQRLVTKTQDEVAGWKASEPLTQRS